MNEKKTGKGAAKSFVKKTIDVKKPPLNKSESSLHGHSYRDMILMSNAKNFLWNMTADFDRTAHWQCNHQCLTEIQQILTEHYWLCFDRTSSLTEHLGNLLFDRTVNEEMFCEKNSFLEPYFCQTEPNYFLAEL